MAMSVPPIVPPLGTPTTVGTGTGMRKTFSSEEVDEVMYEVTSRPHSVSTGPSSSSTQPQSRLPLKPRYEWRGQAPSRVRVRKTYTVDNVPRRVTIKHAELKTELEVGDEFYESVGEYRKHFLPAIEAERLESDAMLKERLSSWGVQKLKDEGYCMTEMSAYWMAQNQFGKPTAAFSAGPGVVLPPHKFENGTPVLVSRADPLKEQPIYGSVVGITPTQIRVAFKDKFDLRVEGGRGVAVGWRLDVGRPNIVFERMEKAVQAMNYDPAEWDAKVPSVGEEGHRKRQRHAHFQKQQWELELEGKEEEVESEYALQGTYLRDVILKGFGAAREGMGEAEMEMLDDVREVDDGIPFVDDDGVPIVDEVGVSGEQVKQEPAGAFAEDQRIQSWVKRYSLPVPLIMEGDMPLKDMNPSQVRAIASMIGNRVSLVQGPPGTGKTKTIIETIRLLKQHFQVPHPILVCTYTNVAVDHLVEGLAGAGVKPLRVGTSGVGAGQSKASIAPFSLQTKLEAHRLYPVHTKLLKEEEELSAKVNETETILREAEREFLDAGGKGGARGKRLEGKVKNVKSAFWKYCRMAGIVRGKKFRVMQVMMKEITDEADVICTTCLTSVTSALNVVDFPVVFLDEASMATEPVSLIPLMKGAKHVALIGDHKQLPPVIVSQEAQSLGLGVSLFERLTKEGDVPSVMLDVQYRMHPAISKFPSDEFYLGTLRDGTVDAMGKVREGLGPPVSEWLQQPESKPSVVFLDHAGNETMKDRSRVNHTEAHIIASVVVDLLLCNPDLRGRDIGIIAPYVAQISLLTRIFNTDSKFQAKFREVLGDTAAMQLSQVEIKTVDGFEGREKEVIIFSTVRNNTGGHIGFLADKRRLNVGLTRAKRALFVVGSISTLREGKVSGGNDGGPVRVGKGASSWRRYAEFLIKGGMVVDVRGKVLRQRLGRE
ncbi:P-loop containing nucleoside triphosphate hydrolase protein [Coprinopsis marcescibilis]|uniref:P-loop containing nucleoside triphosphate hydrolase protein n=1 Tax=Coprinopsis marcescibilis TaxID=230819 RepID=A0A5C3KJY6_COPMA|nr:P-loop containing nucleoside triphosphate hydrolase protein [Coprinopsis marcescibilis]